MIWHDEVFNNLLQFHNFKIVETFSLAAYNCKHKNVYIFSPGDLSNCPRRLSDHKMKVHAHVRRIDHFARWL